LAAIERELSRLPADELPHAELVTIAEGIRHQLYGPVLAAQQRAREEQERHQAHLLLRPLRVEGGILQARRWLGRHPDLDAKTRTDLERTVRQALDRDLDGSESDAAVQRRVEQILEDAITPIRKAMRETGRQALIAHGIEYAAEELAQEENLSSWERTAMARAVKRALEDAITGTECDGDVEALVDDFLDDVLGEPADDEDDDTGLEDDDDFDRTNRAVVRFYNQRGTAEQWIKEGKTATHWTRLSCHRFRANEVRLLLGVIAYNLGNLLRRLVLPDAVRDSSLTSLQQRLFKTGGRLIRHARYFALQLAESYLTGNLFRQILWRIERLAWHPT